MILIYSDSSRYYMRQWKEMHSIELYNYSSNYSRIYLNVLFFSIELG